MDEDKSITYLHQRDESDETLHTITEDDPPPYS